MRVLDISIMWHSFTFCRLKNLLAFPLTQGTNTAPNSAASTCHDTNIGTVISNLKSILMLINERVIVVSECKRSVIQILNTLLAGKATDPSLLLCIFDLIEGWIEVDFGQPSSKVPSTALLSQQEIVSFLQRLSQVDKQNFPQNALEEWENKYFQLLYGLCADSTKYVVYILFM